jgi:hypothetical protein
MAGINCLGEYTGRGQRGSSACAHEMAVNFKYLAPLNKLEALDSNVHHDNSLQSDIW